MPLSPRYTWEENESTIALQISLPGTALKYVDVYVSDLVLKVNASPYVLLLDLLDTVDETSAVVKRNALTHMLHINIHKSHAKLWNQLTFQDTKAALKERRLASMERERKSQESLAEKRKDRKHLEEKQTLRAQMAVDDTTRQILSDLKAEEKEREERAMYETFRELQMKEQKAPQHKRAQAVANEADTKDTMVQDNQTTHRVETFQQGNRSILKQAKSDTKKKRSSKSVSFDIGTNPQDQVVELGIDGSFDIESTPISLPSNQISSDEENDSETELDNNDMTTPMAEDTTQQYNVMDSVVEVVELPPPRSSTQLDINFSPRVFPTPMRESQAADEENWLIKNRKHLRKHQGLRHSQDDDYDISESDPMWLKAKADDFFRSRDYRSALNAYGEAISLATDDQNDLLVTCLSNRAACSLQLAEFETCQEDCSKALSMLPDTPVKPNNDGNNDATTQRLKQYRLKLKLLVRRGTAFCRLGMYTEAKADYGVALTMDNSNPALQQDYFELIQLDNAQKLKEKGDEAFKLNDLNVAIQHYNESVQLNPLSIATLSNRAACHLRRHELQPCVDDCSRALELMQQSPPGAVGEENGSIAFFSVGPAPGSNKRRAWVIKTMVRRATALVAMHNYKKAMTDYEAAVELDPSNTSLKADLAKIQAKVGKNDKDKESLDDPVACKQEIAP